MPDFTVFKSSGFIGKYIFRNILKKLIKNIIQCNKVNEVIYAFQELKKELKGIDGLRFIFTSPTFTTEKAKKEKREFSGVTLLADAVAFCIFFFFRLVPCGRDCEIAVF